MKARILLVLTLFFALSFGSTSAQAQDNELETITTELSLSPIQVRRWKMVDKAYDSKMREVANSDISTAEKKDKLRELRAEKDSKFRLFLSDEQWEKLLAYRAAKQGN